jgi:PAS domain S-box-containing protein
MPKMSNQTIKRIVVGMTLLLFVLGYSLIVKAGITDMRNLFSFLIASYLVLWGGYALISRVPRDENRIRFVLLTMAVVVALFLAEMPAWLKVTDYRKVFSTGIYLWEQAGYLPDVELLARPEPHHSAKILFNRGNLGDSLCLPNHQAEPFELKYDHNGFRNDADLTSADIAVVGDSYVESTMMPTSMLSTTQLAGKTLTTVANLGQSGYGPQQELAVIKRYALPLRPKYLVWVFYEGNDLLDVQEYPEMVSLLNSRLDSLGMVWDRSFTKNSLSWLMNIMQGCVPPEKPPAVPATVRDGQGKAQRVYVKGRTSASSLTKQDLEALKTSVAAIEEAYRLVKEEGGRFVVVFAPTAFRVYQDIARFETDGRESPPWVLDDLPERLRKMVSEISPDIGYLDLTPALKAAAREGSLVFLPDDTHWSVEGHRVVGETLARAVTEQVKMAAVSQLPAMPTRRENILSKDAVMIRNLDGTIRYWSGGAQKLYGWAAQDALGVTSHRLLETVFPAPLEAIEEELRAKGYWEGQLIHKRRDGSKITVTSHWDLQENPTSQDQSITVIEVNDRSNS